VVGLVGCVVGGDVLVVGGGEHAVTTPVALGVVLDSGLPSVTVTSRRLKSVFAAHWHRLHDWGPAARIVDPLPLIVTGVVTTGKPPAPGLVPPVATV
jgi:hypothetical protein